MKPMMLKKTRKRSRHLVAKMQNLALPLSLLLSTACHHSHGSTSQSADPTASAAKTGSMSLEKMSVPANVKQVQVLLMNGPGCANPQSTAAPMIAATARKAGSQSSGMSLQSLYSGHQQGGWYIGGSFGLVGIFDTVLAQLFGQPSSSNSQIPLGYAQTSVGYAPSSTTTTPPITSSQWSGPAIVSTGGYNTGSGNVLSTSTTSTTTTTTTTSTTSSSYSSSTSPSPSSAQAAASGYATPASGYATPVSSYSPPQISGSCVVANALQPAQPGQAMTFNNIPSDTYTVVVIFEDENGLPISQCNKPVTIAAGQTTTPDLPMQPVGTVSSTGAPVSLAIQGPTVRPAPGSCFPISLQALNAAHQAVAFSRRTKINLTANTPNLTFFKTSSCFDHPINTVTATPSATTVTVWGQDPYPSDTTPVLTATDPLPQGLIPGTTTVNVDTSAPTSTNGATTYPGISISNGGGTSPRNIVVTSPSLLPPAIYPAISGGGISGTQTPALSCADSGPDAQIRVSLDANTDVYSGPCGTQTVHTPPTSPSMPANACGLPKILQNLGGDLQAFSRWTIRTASSAGTSTPTNEPILGGECSSDQPPTAVYQVRPTLFVLLHGAPDPSCNEDPTLAGIDQTLHTDLGLGSPGLQRNCTFEDKNDAEWYHQAEQDFSDFNAANPLVMQAHFMEVHWDGLGSNVNQTSELADRIKDFLHTHQYAWDVVVLGHSRGGIFANDMSQYLDDAKVNSLSVILLDATAALPLGDHWPTGKPAAITGNAWQYDDNQPFSDFDFLGADTTSDKQIPGYSPRVTLSDGSITTFSASPVTPTHGIVPQWYTDNIPGTAISVIYTTPGTSVSYSPLPTAATSTTDKVTPGNSYLTQFMVDLNVLIAQKIGHGSFQQDGYDNYTQEVDINAAKTPPVVGKCGETSGNFYCKYSDAAGDNFGAYVGKDGAGVAASTLLAQASLAANRDGITESSGVPFVNEAGDINWQTGNLGESISVGNLANVDTQIGDGQLNVGASLAGQTVSFGVDAQGNITIGIGSQGTITIQAVGAALGGALTSAGESIDNAINNVASGLAADGSQLVSTIKDVVTNPVGTVVSFAHSLNI